MSLHRYNGEYTGTGMREYQGSCICGWQSPVYEPGSNYQGVDRARDDYVTHVEEMLGVEDAYLRLAVECMHCGIEQVQAIAVGTTIQETLCSRCGVQNLRPGNEVWRRHTEKRSPWGF